MCRYDAVRAALAENKWPLYFFGKAGRGKSFVAALVFAEWERKIWYIDAKHQQVLWQHEPIFWKSSDIISELVDARFKNQTGLIKKACQEAGLIVIDDVIDRGMTDARRSALCDILEWRRESKKAIIITGNFAPMELSDAIGDERIVSRILSGHALEFGGPDLRMQSIKITKV